MRPPDLRRAGFPRADSCRSTAPTRCCWSRCPDVGPVTAGAILSWRDEHGAFTSVDELLEVDGIGEATLARLAPLVTL